MNVCITPILLALKVLHEYRDGQWNELLDKTLAEFLKSRTGSQSREEILKVVGISRFNQTSASVRCVLLAITCSCS